MNEELNAPVLPVLITLGIETRKKEGEGTRQEENEEEIPSVLVGRKRRPRFDNRIPLLAIDNGPPHPSIRPVRPSVRRVCTLVLPCTQTRRPHHPSLLLYICLIKLVTYTKLFVFNPFRTMRMQNTFGTLKKLSDAD